MNPTERRRIVWGRGEHENLDPFVVDVFGRVFNAKTDQPITALTPRDAAKAWNQHGGGDRWHGVNSEARTLGDLAGARLPPLEPRDLLRGWPDDQFLAPASGEGDRVREKAARWLFDLRLRIDVAYVMAYIEPCEWLPLAGDPSTGWFEVEIESRFVSVFHGPSVAAWLFDKDDISSTTPY